MPTDWKKDMAMVDSMGDPLHPDSVTAWNTVCYTGNWLKYEVFFSIEILLLINPDVLLFRKE